nr:potassium:hydrogen antiporter 1 [Cryptomonas paramecium]
MHNIAVYNNQLKILRISKNFFCKKIDKYKLESGCISNCHFLSNYPNTITRKINNVCNKVSFITKIVFYVCLFSPCNTSGCEPINLASEHLIKISSHNFLNQPYQDHVHFKTSLEKITNFYEVTWSNLKGKTLENIHEMNHHVPRSVKDTLILLFVTATVIPLSKINNISPILGFLLSGLLLGPNGFGLIHQIENSKILAEFGIVFFLFEMGLELSLSRLKSLGLDVFGLGFLQWLTTGLSIGSIFVMCHSTIETAVVIGFSLALSSSAFVLQILSERREISTKFGRASFGILLFQDLAVVPLLVIIPLLSAGKKGIFSLLKALWVAGNKAILILSIMIFGGKTLLQPAFRLSASSKSPEAFIATILLTVLTMSTLTESIGLSNTLGAFLAGVLLAETKYKHQVEADIAPLRGLLLGLFFITVGFAIDISLVIGNFRLIICSIFILLVIKTFMTIFLGIAFGLNFSNAQKTGLVLAQGGEFAFVTFGLAFRQNLISPQFTQLLFLVVALSMSVTPLLASVGSEIGNLIENRKKLIGAKKEDINGAKDCVIVIGFGRVGQSVCELLNVKLIRYIAFDLDPSKVIEAKNRGFSVFFGDACRPEVLKAAGIKHPKSIVLTLNDKDKLNEIVNAIRREYPTVQIFARAKDAKHQKILQLCGATAIVPELLESSLLLGGAVLLSHGISIEEVNSLIEDSRKKTFSDAGLEVPSVFFENSD